MTRKKIEILPLKKVPPFSQQCRECGRIAHTSRFVKGTGGTDKPPLCRKCYGKLKTDTPR
jgi:NAD-dependent SIR2 family protein deacetylase